MLYDACVYGGEDIIEYMKELFHLICATNFGTNWKPMFGFGFGLCIVTKISHFEWPWVAKWPSLCVISHYTSDFGANCVKVIQGRRFGTVRKPVCDFLLASNTYILSGTIPSYCGELLKLLLLTWVPLLNSGILGEPLNSEQQNLAQKTRNITLLCGAQHILIYWAI